MRGPYLESRQNRIGVAQLGANYGFNPGSPLRGGYTFNQRFTTASVAEEGFDGLGYDAGPWLAVSAVTRFRR